MLQDINLAYANTFPVFFIHFENKIYILKQRQSFEVIDVLTFNNKMDYSKISINNCIKLNKTTMIINYGDHVNNETIKVVPIQMFPFIHYNDEDLNDDSTSWFNVCGPIVLLLRELTKFRHAW